MRYDKIYETYRKTPDIFRIPINLIPLSYRLGGKTFINTLELLNSKEKSEEYSGRYQKNKLCYLLKLAVKNVPYYKNIKLSGEPYKDLKKFPIVDKELIRNNFNLFINQNIKLKKSYYVTTGGTTSSPFGFYLDNSTYGAEWAFVVNAWKRVGFKLGDKIASFRGIEFNHANKTKLWQTNPIYNMLEFSPFHMSNNNIRLYIEKLNKYKPKFIHGYPSAISILAKYIDNHNVKLNNIEAILAISENIYPGQREYLENIFNTRLFSFYGMSEKVVMAPECEYDTRYHCHPFYGHTEVIDKNNNVNEGEFGEVVGTGFLNESMPFIRYRTGDYAKISNEKCICGRNHLLLENLKGRWKQEMIYGQNGSPISITSINFHSNIFKNVNKIQIIQNSMGVIDLLLEKNSQYNVNDEKNIYNAFSRKFSDILQVNILYTENINLTKRGKGKLLIQNLKSGNRWLDK